jgi:uncharacterized protein YecT (DUF1311 family)
MPKSIHLLAYTLFLLLVPLTCLAESDRFLEPPYGASKSEIEDALKHCAGNQMQINICSWHRYIEDEKALQEAVAALRDALPDDKTTQDLLQKSQDAFIQFRNATCMFDKGSGSMAFMALYNCRSAYTKRRTAAVRTYVDCMMGTSDCDRPYRLYIYENANRP